MVPELFRGPVVEGAWAPENGSTSSFFSIRSGPGGVLRGGSGVPSGAFRAEILPDVLFFTDYESRSRDSQIVKHDSESPSGVHGWDSLCGLVRNRVGRRGSRESSRVCGAEILSISAARTMHGPPDEG